MIQPAPRDRPPTRVIGSRHNHLESWRLALSVAAEAKRGSGEAVVVAARRHPRRGWDRWEGDRVRARVRRLRGGHGMRWCGDASCGEPPGPHRVRKGLSMLSSRTRYSLYRALGSRSQTK